jgi:hypothetical protein
MNEIDGISSFSSLKYDTYKLFDTFWFINIDGDQHIVQKKTPLKTRSFFCLEWYTLKILKPPLTSLNVRLSFLTLPKPKHPLDQKTLFET